MSKFLSKHQIMQADDRKVQEVEVPEWSGSVLVKELSVAGRAQLEEQTLSINEKGETIQDIAKQRVVLTALSIVDEKGEQLFTVDEISALNEKSYKAIKRVYDVAVDLSFPSIDEAVKN